MHERILLDPKGCHGKPAIRGTRVPVVRVIGSLAGGASIEDIQRDYGVTVEDIRAALDYAAELLSSERHHRLPA